MEATTTAPTEPRLLGIDQAARLMNVTAEVLRSRYRRDPYVKNLITPVGRTLVVRAEDLEQLGRRVRTPLKVIRRTMAAAMAAAM